MTLFCPHVCMYVFVAWAMPIEGYNIGFRVQFLVDWPHIFSNLCLKLLMMGYVLAFILLEDSEVWFVGIS